MPSVVGFGAVAGGDADVTPAYPGGFIAGDFAMLFAETAAELVPAVAGYDEAPGSPLDHGTNTRLTVRSLDLSGGEGNPTVPDPGNHVAAAIGVFRDVDLDDPFHVIALDNELGTTTTPSFPGLQTLLPDCLIVLAAAYNMDDAGPIASGAANASLANLTERVDGGTIAGNGGGLVVYTGEKAAAGVVSPTGWTASAASATPSMAIALKPKRKVTIGGTVEIDGDPAPNGVGVVRIFDLTVGDTEVVADIAGGAGAFTALVRYATHDYVAVYDDGTNRGASAAAVAGAATHDIEIGGAVAAPTEPVAATATTATAIREELASAIADLTPGLLPTHEFKRYQKDLAFETAMKQGPGHSFRQFRCWFDKESKTPITRNGTNQRWRYTFHVDVAYPATHYATLDVPRDELDAAEDDDQRLIQDAIWNIENATWIKSGSSEPTSETVDGVTFVHYVAQFEFIRAMP